MTEKDERRADLIKRLDDTRDWGNKQRDRANEAERKNRVLIHIMKEAVRLLAFMIRDGL